VHTPTHQRVGRRDGIGRRHPARTRRAGPHFEGLFELQFLDDPAVVQPLAQ
jgi:hypothetical protein